VTMLVPKARVHHSPPRFQASPWHDCHPGKLDLEQRLPPDHLARVIDQAVARLDLTGLRAAYHGTGSDAHPPERLLAVVLFEMRRGQHRPAAWHRDAAECEPVRWLLRGATVARSCWYAFRDRVGPLLQTLHQQVLRQALDAGLTAATRAAVDGTLVAANASRHKLLNAEALQRRAQQLAAALADDAAAAALTQAPSVTPRPAAAAADTAAVPPPPAWLATTAAGRRQQQRRLQRGQERLAELHGRNNHKWPSKRKAAAAVVVSLGDPEAVVARDKEKVYRPLYNMQIVDDLDSPLILGYDVLAQQNDAGVLAALLARFCDQAGHALQELLSDGSYAGGADLAAAQAAAVTVYAPVPGDGVKTPKKIPKKDFAWRAAEQTYVCPQGHRLVLEESWQEKRSDGAVQVWRYRCPAGHCRGCPLQPRCTTTPDKGRAVTRQEHDDLIDALRARMAAPAAQALYKLRKQTVELVNADLKQHRQLRRFSGRGLARVRAEVGLLVLAHNLLTLVNEEHKAKAQQDRAAAASSQSKGT